MSTIDPTKISGDFPLPRTPDGVQYARYLNDRIVAVGPIRGTEREALRALLTMLAEVSRGR